MEEVGELAEVVKKNKRMEAGKTIKGTIEEELQDVLYYIICIANLNNIDLQECIYLKEEINCQKYNRKNMFEKDYEKYRHRLQRHGRGGQCHRHRGPGPGLRRQEDLEGGPQ